MPEVNWRAADSDGMKRAPLAWPVAPGFVSERSEKRGRQGEGSQLIMHIENDVGRTNTDAALFDEPYPRERQNAGRPLRRGPPK